MAYGFNEDKSKFDLDNLAEPITFTLSSVGDTNFSVYKQKGCKKGDCYYLTVYLDAKQTIQSGEIEIGSLDVSPPDINISGVVLQNSSTQILGACQASTSGKLYLRLNETISASTRLQFSLSGIG